jgi:signal transduction histidine kinase
MYGKTPGLKIACFLPLMLFFNLRLHAQQTDSSLADVTLNGALQKQLIAGPISYFIDSLKSSNFSQIRQTPFNVPLDTFLSRIITAPNRHEFWLKFRLTNLSDSSVPAFIYCGEINFTEVYFISGDQSAQYSLGGNLRSFPRANSFLPKITHTTSIRLQPLQQGEIFLKMQQKTEEFNFNGISLYDEHGLYQTIGEDYIFMRHFYIFQLLFQGILICQLIYVLFQWIIIRRREYLYYFFYLLVIALYFLSKYEFSFHINLLFVRFPLLTVYLNKTLLILPYFFYFRFIRSFLEMSVYFPRLNKWIIWIEYFLLGYLIFDLSFILTTFNVKLQRELYTYVLITVFIISAIFIFYLFTQKKTLIYYIVSGSFFVGLGNMIGLVITYLQDENIVQSVPYLLVFSQAGILLEIFCFTAGLSYKSMSAEKEKIKSQQNLIEQLKANELLQTKMQNIRNTIAQDLHDDIGSTLSSISILSNLAIKEKNTNQTLASMREIKDSSVMLMEKMDDIVWSINPRNDSLENLLLRIKRFATSLFEAKNIDYTIIIQDNINNLTFPMDWRQHIYLILKEAINNLVKYAEATRASIRIIYQDDIMELLLQDNGKGFDVSKAFAGNGLTSMKNRADLMGGELTFSSSSQEGTRISLRLKIK